MAAKRGRETFHFLLVLRNYQPLVALLQPRYVDQDPEPFLGLVRSEDNDQFRIGALSVTLGETDGFETVLTGNSCTVVAVDSIALVDADIRGTELKWLTIEHTTERLHSELETAMGQFYRNFAKLFVPPPAESSIRAPWNVVELPAAVQVVPDLNRYFAPKSVLIVQFDCATQKSRHIVKLVKEHLQFHPNLRVVFLSCRIVHAHDVKADLDAAFPEGCGMQFSLYSDKNANDTTWQKTRIVVQLNSINQYTTGKPYQLVVMDEICSILSFFTVGNRTMKTTGAGGGGKRTTLSEHVGAMSSLCRGCDKLLLADAHVSMSGKVKDFLDGALLPGTPVTHLVGKGKNPACKRTLRLHFDPAPAHVPMDDAVRKAAERVLADPEQRIFIFCGAESFLCNRDRQQGSYERTLLKYGVTRIKIVVGSTGDSEKQQMFENLDDTLRDCQAFLCNSAVTVGLNPRTKFGTIIMHTHQGGAVAADVFQAAQRIGRGEGLLADTTIEMMVHDRSPAEKQAVATSLAVEGKPAAHRWTFAECQREVRRDLHIKQADNKRLLADGASGPVVHGGFTEVPDWVVNVAAWNMLARKLNKTEHVEEILRFAKFHAWDVEIADDPAADAAQPAGAPTSRLEDNEWIVAGKHLAYQMTANAVTDFAVTVNADGEWESRRRGDEDGGDDEEVTAAREFVEQLQQRGEVETPTAMHKKIQEAYFKVFVPFGTWLDPMTSEPFGRKDAIFVWEHADPMKHRAVQAREESVRTQRLWDRHTIFTNDSKVDVMSDTTSRRTEAGLELRRMFGVQSVVDEFQLPLFVTTAITVQMNSETHNDRFDGDTELYEVLGRLRKDIAISNKGSQTSALYQDLKKALAVFTMEFHWPGKKPTQRPYKIATYDGEQSKVLHPGFRVRPANKALSDHVLVSLPLAPERRVTVGELPFHLDAAQQSTVESIASSAAEERGLLVDVDIAMCQQGYTELFDRRLLEAIHDQTKPRGDHEEYNESFRDGYGLMNDTTGGDGSMQKLLRDISSFMAMPHEGGIGRNDVQYHYKFGDQLARRYASGPSFQNITGGLRKTLAQRFYWDLDFENSYPTILKHTFVGKDGDLAQIQVFDRYCQPRQREAVLCEIMSYYEVSRNAAKSCILAHCHGGAMDGRRWKDANGREKHTGWMNEWDVSDDVRLKVSRDGHLPLVVAFGKECDVVCKALTDAYPEFKDTLEQVNNRMPDGKKKTGRMGAYSALSFLMATLEDGLLRHLETFLRSKNYRVDSLEFDGLKPRRPDGSDGAFPVPVLREAEVYLAAQTLRGGVKIPMKLSEKPLVTPYGAVLGDFGAA